MVQKKHIRAISQAFSGFSIHVFDRKETSKRFEKGKRALFRNLAMYTYILFILI